MKKKLDSNVLIKPIVQIIEINLDSKVLSVCFEIILPLIDTAVATFSEQNYLNSIIVRLIQILFKFQNENKNGIFLKILEVIETIYKKYPKQLSIAINSFSSSNTDKIYFSYLINILDINKHHIYEYLIQNTKSKEKGLNTNTINTKINSPNITSDIYKIALESDFSNFIPYLNKSNIKSFLYSFDKITNKDQLLKILKHTSNILLSDSIHLLKENVPLVIEQLINLHNRFNNDYSKIVIDILNMVSTRIDKELYFQAVTKFINNKNTSTILQILLNSIKNSIPMLDEALLLSLLPSFIESVFDCLNNQMSDVRKVAVYCIVEIYISLGKEFDPYLSMLTPTQRNLVNIYIGKPKNI